MMGRIGWYLPREKTTRPGELMAVCAWCLNPKKGSSPPAFCGGSGMVLRCTEPLSLDVPRCQLLPVPLSCCRSVAPLVGGPWLETPAGVPLCLQQPSSETSFQGSGERVFVRASASGVFLVLLFFFLVIFFLFYSLMKLLRKCSSASE